MRLRLMNLYLRWDGSLILSKYDTENDSKDILQIPISCIAKVDLRLDWFLPGSPAPLPPSHSLANWRFRLPNPADSTVSPVVQCARSRVISGSFSSPFHSYHWIICHIKMLFCRLLGVGTAGLLPSSGQKTKKCKICGSTDLSQEFLPYFCPLVRNYLSCGEKPT